MDNQEIVRVLTIVGNKGSNLKDYPHLNDNFDIVMAAVTNDGFSLEYASDRLKDNKQIAMAAAN